MILRRLVPDAPEHVDMECDGALDRLGELYAPERSEWLRINSVLSVSGSVAGADATSNSLTNRVDRALLGVIRRLADLVLVGAGSVRAECYVMPKQAALAVVTGSGDLTGHHFDASLGPGRLIIVCPPDGRSTLARTLGDVAHDVLSVTPVDQRMPPADIIVGLRERGFAGIVCEGGPTLVSQLVSAGLVDELCLTTSPTLTATAAPFLSGEELDDRRLVLTQLMVDDSGALYARWRVGDETARA